MYRFVTIFVQSAVDDDGNFQQSPACCLEPPEQDQLSLVTQASEQIGIEGDVELEAVETSEIEQDEALLCNIHESETSSPSVNPTISGIPVHSLWSLVTGTGKENAKNKWQVLLVHLIDISQGLWCSCRLSFESCQRCKYLVEVIKLFPVLLC